MYTIQHTLEQKTIISIHGNKAFNRTVVHFNKQTLTFKKSGDAGLSCKQNPPLIKVTETRPGFISKLKGLTNNASIKQREMGHQYVKMMYESYRDLFTWNIISFQALHCVYAFISFVFTCFDTVLPLCY